MADFSFAPNPRYGWGMQMNMGQSLFNALANGYGMMQLYDQTRRLMQTTPEQVAAQQAKYGLEQSRDNAQSAIFQHALGGYLGENHIPIQQFGYSPQSLTGYGANPFNPTPQLGGTPEHIPVMHPVAAPQAPAQPPASPFAYPSPVGLANAPTDAIAQNYLQFMSGG